MSGPRIGELFAGYGGLGLGVRAVYGGTVAWVSDVCRFDGKGNAGHHRPCRAPCSILAHRFPGAVNLGDVTRVDWNRVEPVDILTGGSPCQDLSGAGKRQGMTEGTRSNLWVAMREAIAHLRPSMVVWENVRGAYSAEADSELGARPGLLGDVRRRDGEPVLRALGRVLGDLSDLGYDCRWHGLSAASVGAAHLRPRVFVAATNADRGRRWEPDAGLRDLPVPDSGGAPDTHTYGIYAGAVARWEPVVGRRAPLPTVTREDGLTVLNHRFSEWLMGLPDGWVSDVPGITRNEVLRACGNGVVPQQVAQALRIMEAW